jgi:uridine kinase
MFGDYLVWDSLSEKSARQIFDAIDKKLLLKRFIISIGGISGTRKSETAHKVAERLISSGKECHIISGDDYYITPWHTRNDIRKKDSIIGPDEMDWKRLDWTFETFNSPLYNSVHFFQLSKFSTAIIQAIIDKSSCDVLIFEGLYGCHHNIPADLKVHIGDTDPQSTFKFRKKRKKENEEDTFRVAVVEKECAAVRELQKNANLIIKTGK